MKELVKYFAYGSNLDLNHLKALGVRIEAVEKAVLYDYELAFNVVNAEIPGAGYANVSPAPEARVEGIVIHTDSSSIKLIDVYEEFPVLYNKRYLTVMTGSRKQRKVLVYVGNKKVLRCSLRPSKDHLFQILKGKDFFSALYFRWLSGIAPA